MGIRIQPRDIDVPLSDPFKNDLLGPKQSVEILTEIAGSFEGPCVFAVDAGWGEGKTTFLRIWERYLQQQEFTVVGFNAWETDFAGDPLVALSTELTDGLRKCMDNPLEPKIRATKKAVKEVLRRAVPGAIRLVTANILDVSPLMEKELAQAFTSYAESRLSEYQGAQNSFEKFRDALQDMANSLSESSQGKPLIVMIDELDRCRPSYAVKLLEVAKHLFSVDHIVFVLAINRSELEHSIKALYGSGFDASGYLRRFFDMEFRLPDPDRSEFIDEALNALGIKEYFGHTTDRNTIIDREEEVVRYWLKYFFSSLELSLRRIAKAIHHLGLVFKSLPMNLRAYAITAVVALIIRTIDSKLYYEFVRGSATDLEVADRVFSPGSGLVRSRPREYRYTGCKFEVMLMLAAHEVSGGGEELTNSPLLKRYTKQANASESGDPVAETDRRYAQNVLADLQNLKDHSAGFSTVAHRFGFKCVVKRLELLSPDLVGNRKRPDHRDS